MAENNEAFIAIKKCAFCRQKITIVRPSMYAYKTKLGEGRVCWYCSWKCMVSDEKKSALKRKQYGVQLRVLRMMNHISMEAMADYLGICRSTYMNYEDLYKPMSPEKIKLAAEGFGCSAEQIFSDYLDREAARSWVCTIPGGSKE